MFLGHTEIADVVTETELQNVGTEDAPKSLESLQLKINKIKNILHISI